MRKQTTSVVIGALRVKVISVSGERPRTLCSSGLLTCVSLKLEYLQFHYSFISIVFKSFVVFHWPFFYVWQSLYCTIEEDYQRRKLAVSL